MKNWFSVKINKTDKPLAKLTKRQRVEIQINTIRNEKGGLQQKLRRARES